MTGNRLPRRILEWDSEEKLRNGRPKERWMDGWMDGIRIVTSQG